MTRGPTNGNGARAGAAANDQQRTHRSADPTRTPDPLGAALASVIAPIVREAVAEALAEHAEGAAPQPELLDRAGLAAALGCSIATVSRLRDEGCPVVWLLDSPRYRVAEVIAWLRSRERRVAAE